MTTYIGWGLVGYLLFARHLPFFSTIYRLVTTRSTSSIHGHEGGGRVIPKFPKSLFFYLIMSAKRQFFPFLPPPPPSGSAHVCLRVYCAVKQEEDGKIECKSHREEDFSDFLLLYFCKYAKNLISLGGGWQWVKRGTISKNVTIDPLDRPTIMAGSDNYFHTLLKMSVRTSVHQSLGFHFSKPRKTKQFSSENSDCCWRDCGSGR